MTQIIVKKIKIAYSWMWNIDERICGICQQEFEAMCSDCKHPLDCKICKFYSN